MDSIVACKTCGQLQRAGGIAFATPDNPGDTPAKNSMRLPLYDERMKGWMVGVDAEGTRRGGTKLIEPAQQA
jgi:hypothetical protein